MVRKKPTPSPYSRRSRSSINSSVKSFTSQRSDGKNMRRPGGAALQEIKHLQKTVHLLIPRMSFQNAVRQIVLQIAYRHSFTETLRFSKTSLEALQEAAEAYLVNFFEDALICTLHARRVTLMVRDFELTRRMRGPSEVSNR